MDLANVFTTLWEMAKSSLVDARLVAVIFISVLGLTYAAIIAVALFHPDEQRRADARLILRNHRFARKVRQTQ